MTTEEAVVGEIFYGGRELESVVGIQDYLSRCKSNYGADVLVFDKIDPRRLSSCRAYEVDTEDLKAGGVEFSYDGYGNLLVRVEEPVIESALRVVAMCRSNGVRLDTSSYNVLHSALLGAVDISDAEDWVVRCGGFSSEWLCEEGPHIRLVSERYSSFTSRIDFSWGTDHPYDEERGTRVGGGVVLVTGVASRKALPFSFGTRVEAEDVIYSPRADVLDGVVTATFGEVGAIRCRGCGVRDELGDLPQDGVLAVVLLAERVSYFEQSWEAHISGSLRNAGAAGDFDRVVVEGSVINNPARIKNPWTGESFWRAEISVGGRVGGMYLTVLTRDISTPGLEGVPRSINRGSALVCEGEFLVGDFMKVEM